MGACQTWLEQDYKYLLVLMEKIKVDAEEQIQSQN